MTALSEWTTFYAIVGAAAASLIGLQFVMMALIADLPSTAGEEDAGNAFASPTMVHFSAVLLITAFAVMPWHSLKPLAWIWRIGGLGGALYVVYVIRRMVTQSAYKPVAEDWLFHALLPMAGYVLVVASGLLAFAHSRTAAFVVAGAALVLLFTGIHNAWDSATYIVFTRRKQLMKRKS
jgi:hypothetical protein